MTDSGRNQYHSHSLLSTKDLEAKMHNRHNHVAMAAYKNGLATPNLSDPLLGHSAVHHMLPTHRGDLSTHLNDSKIFPQSMQYPAQAILPYAAYDPFSAPASPYQLPGSPDIRSSPLYPYSLSSTLERRQVDYGGIPGKNYSYGSPLDESQKYKFPPTYTSVGTSSISSLHSKTQFTNMQKSGINNGGHIDKSKHEKDLNNAKATMKNFATLESNNAYSESHSSNKYNSSSSLVDIQRQNLPYTNVPSSDILASQKYEPTYNQAFKTAMYSNGNFRGSKSPVNADLLTPQHSRNGSPYLPYPHISSAADRYPNFPPHYPSSPYSEKSIYPSPLQNYTVHTPNYYAKDSIYSSPKSTSKSTYPPDLLMKQNAHSYPDFKNPMFSGRTATPPYNQSVSLASMPGSAMLKKSKVEESPKKLNSKNYQRLNKIPPLSKPECPPKLPTVKPIDHESSSKGRPIINHTKPLIENTQREKVHDLPHQNEVLKDSSKDDGKARTSVIQKHNATASHANIVTMADCTTTLCTSVTTSVNIGYRPTVTTTVVSTTCSTQPIVTDTSTEKIPLSQVSQTTGLPHSATAPVSVASPQSSPNPVPVISTSVNSTVTISSKRRSSLRDSEEFLYGWVSSSDGELENDDPEDEDFYCPTVNSTRRPRSDATMKRPIRKSSRRSLESNKASEIISEIEDSDKSPRVFSPFSICDIDKDDAERAVKACIFNDEIKEQIKQEKNASLNCDPVTAPPPQKKRPGRPRKIYPEGEAPVKAKRKYVRKKPYTPRNKATPVKRDASDTKIGSKMKKRKYNREVEEDISDGQSPNTTMSPLKSEDQSNNLHDKSASDVACTNDMSMEEGPNLSASSPDADGKPKKIVLPTLENQNNANIKISKMFHNFKNSSPNKHWRKSNQKDDDKTKQSGKGQTKIRKSGDGLNRFGMRKKKRGRKPKVVVVEEIPTQLVPEKIIEPTEDTNFVPIKGKESKRNLSFELPPTPDEFSCSDDGLTPENETITEEATFAQLNIKKLTCNAAVGETVLHKAAKFGYIDHLMYYLDRGHYDVNVTDNAGYTPLHEASVHNQREAALFLLTRGADVTKCSVDGTLPLHDSVVNDHLEMSRIFLACGADPLVSKFSGTNILSMFYSENMKQFINAHLKEVKSNSNDPDTSDTKWRMPCSAVFDKNTDHLYNTLDHPPQSQLKDVEFEFFDSEPIPTYLLQVKPNQERALYCLMDDLIKYSGNNDIEYEKNLSSEFISYDVFKLQINESNTMKKTVNLSKIYERCTLGSIPCPFKVVKYNEIVKRILKVETISLSNKKLSNSPCKNDEKPQSISKGKNCEEADLCTCNKSSCLKHKSVDSPFQPISTMENNEKNLKNSKTELKTNLNNNMDESSKEKDVS